MLCQFPGRPSGSSFPATVLGPTLLRLIVLGCVSIAFDTQASKAQLGPANVAVAPVVDYEVAPTQSFVANVKANRKSIIGSAVDGRVLEYLVNAGEAVDEGQPLAQIRTGTIDLEIAAAEAELRLRQAELAEFSNGSRPEEIRLAEATVDSAQAAADFAQSRLKRAETLFRGAAGVSQDEYEEARSLSLRAAALLVESENRAELVRQGPRQEQLEQAAAKVAVQEGLIEVLRDRREKYTVRSPFRGFVSAELTEAGAWVRQGDLVAEVVEIDPVQVEVMVPESYIEFVEIGSSCPIRIDAIPDGTFVGTIEQIVPLADNRSRTFPVHVRVDNPTVSQRNRLLPGMLAYATIPTGTTQRRTLVHKDALQIGGPTPVVFKVVNNRAVVVPVDSGPAIESWISVTATSNETLSENDLVVVRGNERLRPGQEVQVETRLEQPSFMTQKD